MIWRFYAFSICSYFYWYSQYYLVTYPTVSDLLLVLIPMPPLLLLILMKFLKQVLLYLGPLHGYSTITSSFGYRKAPTSGASTYHSGIDIAVPTGSNLVASFSGEITFLGFQGAGGFTITLKNETYTASYCHVSPDFKVFVGQKVKKGNVIGSVGPKNVYGVPGNPYQDSNRKPHKWCYNRTSFTFYITQK